MTTINTKLPYWHHQLVLSWYHHQAESHQQSFNNVSQLGKTSIEKKRFLSGIARIT